MFKTAFRCSYNFKNKKYIYPSFHQLNFILMKKTLLAFAAIAILGVGCKKEETANNGSTNPNELIVGKWFGVEQTGSVTVTGAGAQDTSFTQTESLTWLRVTFNADGTGLMDSLGMDVDTLSWVIQNSTLLVLDGLDTLTITKLTSTDLHLNQTEVDDSNPPVVVTFDATVKLTK